MARAISKILFILGLYNFLAYLECVRSYAWSKGHSNPDLDSVKRYLTLDSKFKKFNIKQAIFIIEINSIRAYIEKNWIFFPLFLNLLTNVKTKRNILNFKIGIKILYQFFFFQRLIQALKNTNVNSVECASVGMTSWLNTFVWFMKEKSFLASFAEVNTIVPNLWETINSKIMA